MSCHLTFCPGAHLARKVRRGKEEGAGETQGPVTTCDLGHKVFGAASPTLPSVSSHSPSAGRSSRGDVATALGAASAGLDEVQDRPAPHPNSLAVPACWVPMSAQKASPKGHGVMQG